MNQGKLYLRSAVTEDMKRLYEWRNDPETRKNSIQSQEIAYDSHCEWFLGKLHSDCCNIFICMREDTPIGQVRVDDENQRGKISYSISSDFRGNGYGTAMLRLLEQAGILPDRVSQLFAEVKCDNAASQKCFENLGYSKECKNGFVYYQKNLL